MGNTQDDDISALCTPLMISSSLSNSVAIDNSKELASEERHLYMNQVIGLHTTCWRECLHYTLCIVFNILYMIVCAWFPKFYYLLRYEQCTILRNCPYIYVEDGQHRWTFVKVEKLRPVCDYEIADGYIDDDIDKGRDILSIPPNQRMIIFRNRRFIYDELTDMYQLLHCPTTISSTLLQERAKGIGLVSSEVYHSASVYGRNIMAVPLPTILDLIIRECFHPFFVFQVYSVILWCFENYFMFATVIGIMAIAATINNIHETRVGTRLLQSLARDTSVVKVKRDGVISTIPSSELVLGDLVILEDGMTVPCDITILSGSAVMNESMLTGESVPVVKHPPLDLTSTNAEVNVGSDARSTLFAGTIVLQLKISEEQEYISGIVTRTGFYTNKGNMISSMLYPPKSTFTFETQSYKYLVFFFALATVGMGVAFWKYSEIGASAKLMVLRALDQVTIVVPPSLPLSISIGVSYAIKCLQKKKIFCIEPARITYAGKIKTMCFDKTGTLTNDSLQFGGIHTFLPLHKIVPMNEVTHPDCSDNSGGASCNTYNNTSDSVNTEEEEQKQVQLPVYNGTSTSGGSTLTLENALLPISIRACLSTCHSLAVHNDAFVGDSLEIEAFNAAKAAFTESCNANVLFHTNLHCIGVTEAVPEEVSSDHSEEDPLQCASGTDIEDCSVNARCSPCHTLSIPRFPPHSTFVMKDPSLEYVEDTLAQCQCDCHFYIRASECQCNCPPPSSSTSTYPSKLHVSKYNTTMLSIPKLTATSSSPNGKSLTRMFKQTEHTEKLGTNGREWCVIKQFPFESGLQRMSVVAINEYDHSIHVFAKGAPEKIASLCRPESIPPKYKEIVDWYAHQGNRVIALATKPIRLEDIDEQKQSETTDTASLASTIGVFNTYSSSMEPTTLRENLESELVLLGLLVLENSLKPATSGVIRQLQNAMIRTLMVTGDNVRTAVAVSRDCGIISNDCAVFVSELVHDEITGVEYVKWVNNDNPNITLSSDTFDVVTSSKDIPITFNKMELAVTGECFAVLQRDHDLHVKDAAMKDTTGVELSSVNSLNNSNSSSSSMKSRHTGMSDPTGTTAGSQSFEFPYMTDIHRATLLQKVIVSGAVFARFTPDQKASLVTHLIKMGMYTGMCGDGANDCGALKSAHVGVSLAESEASIAAPFTSQIPDISCVPLVLLEGRSALATTFLLFRFMSLYSFIQYFSTTLLYLRGGSYCDWQFLYQDLFAVFPLAITLGYTGAGKKLTNKRPSANLLSFKNMLSINLHMLAGGLFQFGIWYYTLMHPDHTTIANPDHICKMWEATTMQYFVCLQYILLAIVCSIVKPWKKPFYTNLALLCTIIISCGVTYVCVFHPHLHDTWFPFNSDDEWIPMHFRYMIGIFMIGQIIATFTIEFVIVPFIVQLKKSNMKYHYTNTVFGKGNDQLDKGAKPYHLLRKAFEDNWPMNTNMQIHVHSKHYQS